MSQIARERLFGFFRGHPAIAICCAFIAGIVIGRSLETHLAIPAGLVGLSWLTLAALLHVYKFRVAACWSALVGIIAIGIFHQLQQTPDDGDALSDSLNGERWRPMIFRATIASAAVWRPNSLHRPEEPRSQPWRTQWNVLCDEIRDGQEWRPLQAWCPLSVDGRIHRLLPGDRIEVYGSVSSITAPSNPGEQDLREYYRQQNQFVMLRCDHETQIKFLGTSRHFMVQRWLASITTYIDKLVHRWVVLQQAPLAAALVFGQRQQVDWQDQQQLLATGTLHMLSISGMHVEMVAYSVLVLCLLLHVPVRPTLIVVGLVITFYALISGGNPPVIRATLLVLCACLARWMGRRTKLGNLLATAAIAVLAIRAAWLTNVGVQLSFLAVATIAIFSAARGGQAEKRNGLRAAIEEGLPRFQQWMFRWRRWLVDMLAISFWVWLITAPLIWSNFHIVSPVAVPLNVLLWPLLLVGLLSGLILLIVGWLAPAAWLAGWLCGASLWCITCIVWLAEKLPGAYIWAPPPTAWWIAVFYAICAIWLAVRGFNRKRRSILGVCLLLWFAFGLAPWIVGPRGQGPDWIRLTAIKPMGQNSGELRCTFIDVGHGTSIVLELPSGEIILYDAGHQGAAHRSHQEIANVLWNLKTARIHRLFISHADADHYNAVPGLLDRFAVSHIVAPDNVWQHTGADVKNLCQQIRAAGIAHSTGARGDKISLGNVSLELLHPTVSWRGSDDNSASMCLLVNYAGRNILLSGDIESDGISAIVSYPPIHCEILLAPHHGSLSHDPEPLLQWCRPQFVVISGSHRSVRPEVVRKFSSTDNELAMTNRDGAIQVRISKLGQISKYRWNASDWQVLATQVSQ